jgi:hypothetical protein
VTVRTLPQRPSGQRLEPLAVVTGRLGRCGWRHAEQLPAALDFPRAVTPSTSAIANASVLPGVRIKAVNSKGIVGVGPDVIKLFDQILVGNNVILFGYPTSLELKELAQLDPMRPLLRRGRPRDPARPSPYPGLEALTENDAGVFFGRESRLADALEIIDRLRRHDGSRVLTIIAPSGVGKSSFLRAGLWPRLTRQSGVAPTVILRPGAGILTGREGGLIHSLPGWFQRAGRRISAGDLRSRFGDRSTQEGLASVLTEAAQAAGEGRALILAIDQAEELFDVSDQTRATEAKEFLDALLALLATPPAAVEFLVTLTIRSDSYDPLAAALVRASDAAEKLGAARRQALRETSLTLLLLAATAYRDVIRRPAQVALKTDREIFEPALVDDLVDTFTGADALPLLAMTVEQLFADYGPHQHITRANYQALYGVGAGAEGPVSRPLAEAYRMAGTSGTDGALKRLLIPALVTWDPTVGEAGAARRRIALRAALLADDPDLTRLVDAMASPQARLLTRGRAEAGPTLEVAHEALLRVQPVKRWVEEFSLELRLRDEIEREASEWQRAETRLVTARKESEQTKQLEALQKELDAVLPRGVVRGSKPL